MTLPCRKAFKKIAIEDYVKQNGLERSYSLITSAYGSRRRRASVEKELGNTFEQAGCGCCVGYSPPRTLRELPAWLKSHKLMSDGERLLETIAMKARR